MCIGIFSFRAFDRRLARLAAPISSGVRQGGQNLPPPPAGRVRLNTPAGRGLKPGGVARYRIFAILNKPGGGGAFERPPQAYRR